MQRSERSFLTILAALAVSGAANAQNVTLHAATATSGSSVEVRLRWQLHEGWFPAGGFRLYRVVGGNRQLVRAIPAPTDAAVDSLLEPSYRGRKLISGANVELPVGTKLGLITPDPLSARAEFIRLRDTLDQVRTLPSPILTRQQITQRESLLNQVRQSSSSLLQPRPLAPALSPSAVPTATPTAPSLSQISKTPTLTQRLTQTVSATTVKTTLAARAELHLAAKIAPANAETIGLGATDRQVSAGSRVGYQLYGLNASGQESSAPIASISEFVVGADAQPPAPTGQMAGYRDDTVLLRWDRVPNQASGSFLGFSYTITRTGPAGALATTKTVTKKPLLIMATSDKREPLAFFSDNVSNPGTYTYRITAVDGFGRASSPAILNVSVADWRRPDPPRRAGATLGRSFIKTFSGTAAGTRLLTTASRTGLAVEATVSWLAGSAPHNMPLKYNVYRQDLDNPTAPVAKVTSSPLDGTTITASTEDQYESAFALLLGPNFRDIHKLNLDNIRAQPATTSEEIRARAIAAARAEALFKTQLATIRTAVNAGAAKTFVDASAVRDRKYLYFVTAVYGPTGLESEATAAGQLDIPLLTQPPAVVNISGRFTASPPRVLQISKAPALSTRAPFVGPQIRQSKMARATATSPQTMTAQSPIPRLNLVTPDYGGTVALTWTGVSGFKDIRYQVFRKIYDPPRRKGQTGALTKSEFVEVGLSGPNQPSFNDQTPRSRQRTYTYKVVPISRWGVAGPAVTFNITVPSTAPPEPPNMLAAGPGDGDGQIAITIQEADADQQVARYVVYRDGQVFQTVDAKTASGGIIRVIDTGRAPGVTHAYKAVAETATGVKSPESPIVRGAAVKLTASGPSSLSGSVSPSGVALTWAAAPDAVAYLVRRRVSGATGPAQILSARQTALNFVDTFAMPGRSYSYEVCAIDSMGNISPPSTVSVAVP